MTLRQGRSCTIVPRSMAPQGYMDLQRDDNAEDDQLTSLQDIVMGASHRIKEIRNPK